MPFKTHFFICTNARQDGTGCGHMAGANIHKNLKKNIDAASHDSRINASGCLGHCEQGPALVVYPMGRWYRYLDYADAESIVRAHLDGQIGPTELRIDEIDTAEGIDADSRQSKLGYGC